MRLGGKLDISNERIRIKETYCQLHPEARTGEFVRLAVTDSGSGIAAEHLPRIFEPFFTTKEPGKGTGLGLATAYGIVKQHLGWIEVSSRADGGATFKVFLPAITPAPLQTALPAAEPPPPGGTEQILLAEDDPAVRLLTRRILEAQGYRVWDAATAQEALDLWATRALQIQLLLTDIVMPGRLTGRELADQFRAQKPALKIIFMSGHNPEPIATDTEF